MHVTHQTGEAEYEKVRRGYDAASWSQHVDVRPYIDDMMTEFARADLIISRAGATTSAELVAAGKAAIMIPFPLAADDHQRRNAEALQAPRGGAMNLQKAFDREAAATQNSSL